MVIVGVIAAASVCRFLTRHYKAPERDGKYETVILRGIRAGSYWIALGLFPISFLNVYGPKPSTPKEWQRRDNLVDAYVLGWTLVLSASWVAIYVSQSRLQPVPEFSPIVAWLAGYRVLDVVVGRIFILSTYAGKGDFPIQRARRSLFGSMIVLGQLIIAFAVMFDAASADVAGIWTNSHTILGFSYISTRVIFTLGPPEEPIGWLAKLLVGGELASGFTVIALGIAAYLGTLHGAGQTEGSNNVSA